MDPSHALSELAIELPTTADAIKRAYLRAVKAHPPERDPDGFRRVREAYDFLRERPWCWQKLEDVPDQERALPRVTSATVDSGTEPIPDVSLDAPSDVVLAVEAKPDRPRRAKKQDPQILASWLVEQAKDPSSDIPPSALLAQGIDCTLRLFRRKLGDQGAEVMKTIEDRLERDGVPTRQIGDWLVARSALVRELINLNRRVDKELLGVLARAIQRDDYGPAAREVESLVETDGDVVMKIITKNAPSLLAAMPLRRVHPKRAWSNGYVGWAALIGSYWLLKACFAAVTQ
jgi:hypothetical protein